MADFSLEWGGDLVVDDTGDFAIVDQADELRQRVMRRFLTNSQVLDTTRGLVSIMPDNLFEPTYGGNARAYVDATIRPEIIGRIQNLLLQQLSEEPACDSVNSTVNVTWDRNSGSIVVSANVLLNTGAVISIDPFEIAP
jgi:hypothetical protein